MRIYLDHNATTPVHPEVVERMAAVLRERPGNPSSVHAEGAAARAEVEAARVAVAELLAARPDQIVFCAGASEANNTALCGWAAAQPVPGHIVSSRIEHPSVEEPLRSLEAAGWRVTRLPVDADGLIRPDDLAAAIAADTRLVSIIWANNETGAVQPMDALVGVARERGVPVHADATQAIGKISVNFEAVPVDLASGSAHKFNGPKGVGFLFVRGTAVPSAWVRGGPQERRLRGGTHNVAGIAGLGVAAQLAARELPERGRHYAALRDRLWEGIAAKIPAVYRNGRPDAVLPNTLNVEFRDAAGDVLLEALDLEGVAVSAGAACASGSIEPSPTLTAMGRTPEQALGSLRLSVGYGVDETQIDRVLGLLPDLVARVRGMAG